LANARWITKIAPRKVYTPNKLKINDLKRLQQSLLRLLTGVGLVNKIRDMKIMLILSLVAVLPFLLMNSRRLNPARLLTCAALIFYSVGIFRLISHSPAAGLGILAISSLFIFLIAGLFGKKSDPSSSIPKYSGTVKPTQQVRATIVKRPGITFHHA
jgi:hypothetical protein